MSQTDIFRRCDYRPRARDDIKYTQKGNLIALRKRAIKLEKEGNLRDAARIFDELTQSLPRSALAWFDKGVCLGLIGDHNAEIHCYTKATGIDRNFVEAWYNKAETLAQLNKSKAAIECYNSVTKIRPRHYEAWNNLGGIYYDLGQYRLALRLYNKALKINPRHFRAWSNKGLALDALRRLEDALSCFDRALAIQPKDGRIWYNKGITLGDLRRDSEALKCFDKSLAIDASYHKAWYSKSVILSRIGMHDKSASCLERVLEIVPDFPEAWYNKGIGLLNSGEYHLAISNFIKAQELFTNQGKKSHAKLSGSMELVARNGSKLTPIVKRIDERFEKMLRSSSLAELSKTCSKLSADLSRKTEILERHEIPLRVKDALLIKSTCIGFLSQALKGKPVNSTEILAAKKMVLAGNRLKPDTANIVLINIDVMQIFCRQMLQYKSVKHVPKPESGWLLQLIGITYPLGAELTSKLTGHYDERPLETVSSESKIELKWIKVGQKNKDCIRVCLAQLDFALTDTFPYRMQSEREVHSKIVSALDIALKEKVDILCFPELSFTQEWVDEIKNRCGDMIVVCGSYYDDNGRNVCGIVANSDAYFYAKCHPSIFEKTNGRGMTCGNKIYLFQTRIGRVGVFNCIDLEYELHRVEKLGLDLVINIRCDPDKDHNFQKKVDVSFMRPDGSRSNTFMAHVNCLKAEYGASVGGGGTTIFGDEHKARIEKYKQDGLRRKDQLTYKLFEARGEMLLLADLNIAGQGERSKSGHWYLWKNRKWKKLKQKGIWL
jgi:tetratricopeptide (TPR) repeat protein/predicted amidohydrolase